MPWCRTMTSNTTSAYTTVYSKDGARKYDATGTNTAAVSAERDEYLNANAITSQIPRAITATGQQVTRIKPNVEATPFPPLNFSHTGKLCPKTPNAPAVREAVTASGESPPATVPAIAAAAPA